MKNVLEFAARKKEGPKISMVTCYDYSLAKIVNQSDVDCVLVGDSVAMVMHGFASTLSATAQMMALHTAAVSRGLKEKFLIADMPFPSFRTGPIAAMDTVDLLMKAGAQAVKIEGVWGHEDVISHVVESGVPVMGHLGLTPQSVHKFGGFKVQGRDKLAADDILAQARKLQDLGVFAVVLECLPTSLASEVTASLQIPTIGIGAGTGTDGQVLVLQDLLGLNLDFKPRFVRSFANSALDMTAALQAFHEGVQRGTFPASNESYL